MARMRIWCRTSELGAGQFLATVCAVPAPGEGPSSSFDAETRLFAKRAVAAMECTRMAEAMRERVAEHGHIVISMEEV